MVICFVEYPPQEFCDGWSGASMVYNAPYAQAPLLPPNSQYLPTICNTSTANQVNNSLTDILLLVVMDSNLIFKFFNSPKRGRAYLWHVLLTFIACVCIVCAYRLPWGNWW